MKSASDLTYTGHPHREDDRRSETTFWQRIGQQLGEIHNHTILFQSGRVIFVTYGVLMAIAFGVGTAAAAAHSVITGSDTARIIQFSALVMMPAVLFGARLFSVLLEWRQLLKDPRGTLLKPGYMLHGGVLGGAVAIVGYAGYTNQSVWPLLDAWAFALPLGEAIARLGCHVYGCCWGKPTCSDFGIQYTSADAKVVRHAPHLKGVRLYPAQLFGSVAHLVLFAGFVLALPVVARQGQLVGLYLVIHPALRVILERFRKDDRGKLIGPLTHTNLYSAIQLVVGSVILVWTTANGPWVLAQPSLLGSILSYPSLLSYFVLISLGAGIAFGVHVDQVGQWMDDSSLASARQTGANRELPSVALHRTFEEI